jgi:hypothetical protein
VKNYNKERINGIHEKVNTGYRHQEVIKAWHIPENFLHLCVLSTNLNISVLN